MAEGSKGHSYGLWPRGLNSVGRQVGDCPGILTNTQVLLWLLVVLMPQSESCLPRKTSGRPTIPENASSEYPQGRASSGLPVGTGQSHQQLQIPRLPEETDRKRGEPEAQLAAQAEPLRQSVEHASGLPQVKKSFRNLKRGSGVSAQPTRLQGQQEAQSLGFSQPPHLCHWTAQPN